MVYRHNTKIAVKLQSLSSTESSSPYSIDSSPGATSTDNNNENEAKLDSNITVNNNELNDELNQTSSTDGSNSCNNQILNDEIRNRLDKLNALSDLINSLERQFDEANLVFRETLKCSTDRLGTIARILGSKSIKYGRNYHAARLTVEQNQSECQRACVQFEQANNDHQSAKLAIKEAEMKLRKIAEHRDLDGDKEKKSPTTTINESVPSPLFIEVSTKNTRTSQQGELVAESNGISTILDVNKLRLTQIEGIDYDAGSSDGTVQQRPVVTSHKQHENSICDTNIQSYEEANNLHCKLEKLSTEQSKCNLVMKYPQDNLPTSTDSNLLDDSAQLSEELNFAISQLVEAERKRGISQRLHLDQTNRLMVAQENLMRLEREHGQSIKRSQLYFEEARRFDARLNSVKGEISRISDEIVAAKQAYAETLSDLEKFSEEIHLTTNQAPFLERQEQQSQIDN